MLFLWPCHRILMDLYDLAKAEDLLYVYFLLFISFLTVPNFALTRYGRRYLCQVEVLNWSRCLIVLFAVEIPTCLPL
jgi:hypothetical protein